jgi:hypothetical protein
MGWVVSTGAGWGDYLAADTPAADAGPPAGSVDPPAEPAEVAGAAAEQGWADWHADGAASASNTAEAHADETAGDYEIDIADHIATAAGESIVYEADPGSGY